MILIVLLGRMRPQMESPGVWRSHVGQRDIEVWKDGSVCWKVSGESDARHMVLESGF